MQEARLRERPLVAVLQHELGEIVGIDRAVRGDGDEDGSLLRRGRLVGVGRDFRACTEEERRLLRRVKRGRKFEWNPC